ncbi:FliH/SctL family protein [Desulfitobacterium sp.]|uniref:FliH/SctL family protein n=1 Tax=Desulfitobacterium sp. TaxID=49981 RepID=UPI002BEF4E10|nr:FliH/SctL family protein [Desulfitobacterium sp.]HVJ49543.1 FliH/SctL family protein [Desulfitobacterium sp.]
MNSFISSRVVKSQAVAVSIPRLVEHNTEKFQFLGNHLTVVRDVREEDSQENRVTGLQAEASEMLEQAQAEDILAKARAEAEQIQRQAEVEAAEMKQRLGEEVAAKAQSEGYEKGFIQGQAEGHAEGKAQGEHEVEGKLQQAQALLQCVQNAAQEEFNKVDSELLHLSLKIAEQVIRASLDIEPELILRQIQALTLFPQEREHWRLHVSPENFVWLKESATETQLNLIYVADDNLQPGDSFLECDQGIFDARLDVQLSHLEQLLREELRHEKLGQAGR